MLDHDNLEEFRDPDAYDAENSLDEEGPFLVELAQQYGGPVLDLACGTGRLTLPIARAGLACVGVDLAEEMLRAARARSAGLPIEYVAADVCRFDDPRRFGFALLTGNAFQSFVTAADQRAVLEVAFRHLRPGGGLAFETRNPGARDLTPGERIEWRRSYQRSDGAWIDAHAVTRWDAATRLLHVEQHRRERGTGVDRVSRIALRYTGHDSNLRLLAQVGFRVVETCGDFTCRPVTRDCPLLVYVCERPA